ncbi:MAG: ATP synthase subunit C [Candidatus Methanospirare jalkutatii]|nr:MAG: ATP synthase subunit C [Candidatus Methanospirare jalkutatii]UYZ40255.1 MAG: ATP synthase subunit C [Candidatus Methanospirare jalkutatii]
MRKGGILPILMFSFPFLALVGTASAAGGGATDAWIAIAASIAMAGSAIAAGMAIKATGTAATGATAEKPEVFGRVLIFVALAEALAIYGLLIAFMLWTKIK